MPGGRKGGIPRSRLSHSESKKGMRKLFDHALAEEMKSILRREGMAKKTPEKIMREALDRLDRKKSNQRFVQAKREELKKWETKEG